MAKTNRDTILRHGEELLRQWGVTDDTDPATLRDHIGRDTASDFAIAARLGNGASRACVDALLALERGSADKLVRKEIKRSLYRLAQRGVEVPAPASATPVLIVPGPTMEGYLSPFDGRGDRLVWLLKVRPRGIDQLMAIVNEPEGMREVYLTETSRKELHAAAEEMRLKHEIEMVPADWRYCDFLLAQAHARASENKRTITGDYKALRSRMLHTPPPDWLPPLISTVLDPETVRSDTAALEDSGDLLREKEFRTWFFTPENLKPYLDQLRGVKESPIVLSELQQRDRYTEIIQHALEEIFGGAHRDGWQRRFEEMAYYFHVTRRERQARQMLAVALALASSEIGGREIPFCQLMAGNCFAEYWQEVEQKETERTEGSLVLTPAQALREARMHSR